MQIPFFTLDRQHLAIKSELQNVYTKVIENGQFILGEEVSKFEHNISKYIGVPHAISCGNGTDALELILQGLGIERGKEVIVPSNTWMSVGEAVINSGGIPRYVDIDRDTYILDLDKVDSLISKNTFAIIAVHQFGYPIDLRSFKTKMESQNIYLIEDCAHAIGAMVGETKCGSFGDAAAFSFYPTKNLGALGDAGAVVTSNEELAERIRLLSNHGQVARDSHVIAGRNSRLDELQAAILNLKLRYIDSYNKKRNEIGSMYIKHVNIASNHLSNNLKHVYHQFVVQHDRRDELSQYLNGKGIGTAIHYPESLADMKIFKSRDLTPIASETSRKILSIPIFPELTEEEVGYIIEKINSFD